MDDRLSMGLYVNLLGVVDFYINKSVVDCYYPPSFPMSVQECIIMFARLITQKEVFLNSLAMNSDGMVMTKY